MKIAIWNVMNGMGSSQQIELFKSLCVDLAILPELKQKNTDGLNPKDAVWITNNFSNKTPKGLGVLSFNDTSLRELPRDEDMEIYIPVTVQHPSYTFDLLAVWNFYFACKRGRFKGVKGDGCLEWSAIRKYTKELNSNCLFGGDWNFGPTFAQAEFIRMCEMYKDVGVESLYHKAHNLQWAESCHMTFKSTRQTYHHLDHFFGSSLIGSSMLSYEILPMQEVVLSDHAPVILTLK